MNLPVHKYGKTERRKFGKINEVIDIPDLVEIQKASYASFINEGISEVFEDFSPITDYSDHYELYFLNHWFDEKPKYDEKECRNRDATYALPLHVTVRLVNKVKDEVIDQPVFMGEFPLMTDSGSFTHSDVTAHTFSVAAQLRAAGADVREINYRMFACQKKQRALLFRRALANLRFALDDRLTFILVRSRDLEETGADRSMTEGFVDYPLTIDGVEVSVSLLEMKPGQYKASLRSKGKVNVNAVASAFGGGGHVLASGCMLFGEYEEVVERLTYAVYQHL